MSSNSRVRAILLGSVVALLLTLVAPQPIDACGCLKCVESQFVMEEWQFCRPENPGYTECSQDVWGNCWYPYYANFCECITVTE